MFPNPDLFILFALRTNLFTFSILHNIKFHLILQLKKSGRRRRSASAVNLAFKLLCQVSLSPRLKFIFKFQEDSLGVPPLSISRSSLLCQVSLSPRLKFIFKLREESFSCDEMVSTANGYEN